MKKIITAINNPELNNKLKKLDNFKIIGKDMQYREAILELLEKNKNIDVIIINENILGEITFENLIENIKFINEKIEIIFILNKENNKKNNILEKILKKNKIKIIYYEKNDNLFELIKNKSNKTENNKLKKINNEKNNKIKKLNKEKNSKIKKIKTEKNNSYNLRKNFFKEKQKPMLRHKMMDSLIDKLEKYKIANIGYNFRKQKQIKKKQKACNNRKNDNIMLNKIITFSGNQKSGKTTLALITSQYLSNMNYKILLIDCDFKKKDLSFILKSDLKVNIKNDKIKGKKVAYRKKEKFYKNEYENLKKYETNFLKSKIFLDKSKSEFLKSKDFFDKYKNKILKLKDFFKNNKFKFYYFKYNNYNKLNLNNKIINKLKNNQIKNYKMKNIVFISYKKLNNNFYFLSSLDKILKRKEEKQNRIIAKKIKNIINIMKRKFDYIVIDISNENFNYFYKEIMKISDKNFIVMEPNLLGIREIEDLLDLYLHSWKMNKKNLHIIANKTNMFSINLNLLNRVMFIKNSIIKIGENKKYSIFINNFFKRNILLKNKDVKKDISKIIKIIK